MNEKQIRAMIEVAKNKGHKHLEKLFRELLFTHTSAAAVTPDRKRPLIYLVIDRKGWCGERLATAMAACLKEYDIEIVRVADDRRINMDGNLYVFLITGCLFSSLFPLSMYGKAICAISSERILRGNYHKYIKNLLAVVPLSKEIKRIAGADGVKNLTRVIPNGIDVKSFRPAQGFPEEFVVGAAGNFCAQENDNWKGFSKYVVPACALAGVKLKWAGMNGEAPLSGMRGSQISLEDMPDWYRGISCFVLMSKSESCSCTTSEAMATGLPVISSRVGWHGENCTDEIIWVDRPQEETPENVQAAIEALAAKLIELKNNPAMCAAVGRKARSFAARWPHKRIANKWREIINSCIEGMRCQAPRLSSGK